MSVCVRNVAVVAGSKLVAGRLRIHMTFGGLMVNMCYSFGVSADVYSSGNIQPGLRLMTSVMPASEGGSNR